MKKIDLLFEKLNQSIDYVIFKNYDKIDISLKGDFNFDISVNPIHKSSFQKIISDFNLLKGVNTYDFLNKNVFHYYLFSNDAIYHLHIHYGVIMGTGYVKEYKVELPLNFYNNFHLYKNIKILSEPYYNDLSTLRSNIKSNSLIGLVYIYVLKKEINKNKKNILSFNYNTSKHIKFSFFKNIISFFLKIAQALFTGGQKAKKFFPQGYSIGIGGPDGSGKTTLTDNLYDDLNKVFYVKRFSFGRLAPVKKNQFSKKKTGFISRFKKVGASILRLYISYKILFFKSFNFIVISDRYYNLNGPGMDSFKLDDGKVLSKIERFIYARVPQINLMFLINVSLNTSIARNRQRAKEGKETDEEIQDRYHEFKTTEYKSKRQVVIDNSGTINEGLMKVMNELL